MQCKENKADIYVKPCFFVQGKLNAIFRDEAGLDPERLDLQGDNHSVLNSAPSSGQRRARVRYCSSAALLKSPAQRCFSFDLSDPFLF